MHDTEYSFTSIQYNIIKKHLNWGATDNSRDGRRVSVADTRYLLADTRQRVQIRVRMAPFPQKVGGYPGIPKDICGQKGRWLAGRRPFQPARYKYLVDWKDTLPVDEVLVPCRMEGHPSGQRGTCTSLTGRTPFRSTRYLYLAGWKEALPVDEVQVPRQLEGDPSSHQGTSTLPAGRRPFQPVW
ncbi:uncharacterized protein PGTG_04557 [Puccinia graminis f. sp. tritici CRL 75-36-700-3]|uniref:Extra spindle pole bodies 1 n=1 Tax=Puccinia graminis f. sp. tritici (strain CRL 75-36-700-3 / race SCCL) TaxID=418459 RepID=E3K2N2_PUCGT|nr:uncharacterized protein PGTG_04557 [Puccinia graminis f. sp. tritici CRL 75-36-700-3]EFP78601.1 hypothetical protein PGTG_04557 [Puccinia graminis f. sp. tritici CRL 75-36-700-3]